MPYKFREDLTIADVAFEASGSTLEELFVSAAKAVENTMVRNIRDVRQKITRKLALAEEGEEKLLHTFLEELVYFKDAELLIFNKFNIKITREGKSKIQLTATMKGEKLDQKKHDMSVDVKAVTWHKFSLKKEGKKWKCLVVLDV